MNNPPRKVLVVQRRMTHYRIPFFEALKLQMADRNCELVLAYGNGTDEENDKHDSGEIAWGIRLNTRYAFSGKLCWQPFGNAAREAHMVIVALENKLLYNLLPQFGSPRLRFGLWGHGANLQGNPFSLRERYKRVVARRADWWFGYTSMSIPLIVKSGFPAERITVLNNSVDTSSLQRYRQSITPEEISVLRESLGFGTGPVGVFVGSLYADKRLDFLFLAAERIRCEVPDFQFLIVGEGLERDKVRTWCAAHPWTRWVGARFGREKVAYISTAQVMLNPGLVGLGILDAFVCGVPMFTTNCGIHSPEIAYLESGVNGVMTEDDLDAYVDTSVRLLGDTEALDVLRAGSLASAVEYTVENMARNFADGVTRCLAVPPLRGA